MFSETQICGNLHWINPTKIQLRFKFKIKLSHNNKNNSYEDEIEKKTRQK